MERKLLLVFALTFLVIILSQPLLKKYMPQPPAQPQQVAQPLQASNPPVQPAVTVPTAASKQASGESDTVVENDLYRITFSNKGAQVKSWILKKYDNEAQNGQFDLVNTAAAAQFGQGAFNGG